MAASALRSLLLTLCMPLLLLSVTAIAATPEQVGRQLLQTGQLSEQQLQGLEQSADGLFMLGWLYEYGAYGIPVNGELAFGYYQQAAEQGQMDAAHYCWQRCLRYTPAFRAALARAVTSNNPQALYLNSMGASERGDSALRSADQQLLAAAKLMHPRALSDLYIQHFLDWSAQRQRSFAEARDKLTRCSDEGVIACYLLLGSLHLRHGNAEEALRSFLVLQQLDYGLARRYLSAARLQKLEQRLPKGALPVVQSRAATRLATHPTTGFDSLDRFAVCAPQATWACIRMVSKKDTACMLGYFSISWLSGLRETPHYRRCMGF